MQLDMECSLWPDGWPVWLGGTGTEWLHCCVAHDLGASLAEFCSCLWQVSPPMAVVMVVGVALFGGVYAYSRRVLTKLKQER